MAEYTIELKTIIENGINIFDFKYDFYDETKRKQFEENFIRHFYFNEIGVETIDKFKWFLQDKMLTVFPYYNELFKSASIKYDVLDNYKLTETYTRNYQNDGKSSGITSNVGSFFQNQSAESKQNRNVDTTGNSNFEENGENNSENTSVTETTTENNVTGKSDTTTENTTTGNTSTSGTKEEIRKFLDTPGGSLDLSNSKYLTTLNHDTSTESGSSEKTETTNTSQSTDTSEKSEGTQTGETTETGKTTNTQNGNSATETSETTTDNINNTLSDEQKSTADTNTRNYQHNEHKEEYTLTRRGNIGVDTDSDAIEKHNRLQKTLKSIEKMFFEECEDLFFLVY